MFFFYLQENGDSVRWLRSLAAIPFHKKKNNKKTTVYSNGMPRVLNRNKNRELADYTEIRASWNKTLDPFITHWPSLAKRLRTSKGGLDALQVRDGPLSWNKDSKPNKTVEELLSLPLFLWSHKTFMQCRNGQDSMHALHPRESQIALVCSRVVYRGISLQTALCAPLLTALRFKVYLI